MIAALSFVDIIVIWTWPLKYWLFDVFGVDIEGWSNVVCKLMTILTFSGPDTSSPYNRTILLYILSDERRGFVARRMESLLSLLLVVIFLINSHVLYGFTSVEAYGNEIICGIETFLSSYFSWIDNIKLFLFHALVIIIRAALRQI